MKFASASATRQAFALAPWIYIAMRMVATE